MPENVKMGADTVSMPSPEERIKDLELRVKRTEAALLRVIGQLAGHQHLANGKPAIELELLNAQ